MLIFLLSIVSARTQAVTIKRSNFNNVRNILSVCSHSGTSTKRYTPAAGCDDMTVSSDTLTGFTNPNGGAVLIERYLAKANVNSNTFTNCHSDSHGGAAYIACKDTIFESNHITNCYAGLSAGGLIYYPGKAQDGTLVSKNNVYDGCHGTAFGGSIYLEVKVPTITFVSDTIKNSHFDASGSANYRNGTGIYVKTIQPGTFRMTDCNFENFVDHLLSEVGGAIYLSYDDTTALAKTFDFLGVRFYNINSKNSSIIYITDDKANKYTVSFHESATRNTTIINCDAVDKMSGLFHSFFAVLSLRNVNIEGGTTAMVTGTTGGSLVKLERCTISNYESEKGYFYRKISNINISECIFSNTGKGLFFNNNDAASVVILKSIFRNLWLKGSAMAFGKVRTPKTIIITDCTLDNFSDAFSFISGSEPVSITINNLNVVNIGKLIPLNLAISIELLNCKAVNSPFFNTTSLVKKISYTNCEVNNNVFTGSIIESNIANTLISGCTFNLDKGKAIALSVGANAASISKCKFTGAIFPIIEVSGNIELAGNTFDPNDKPVIKFISGNLKFSLSDLNCIPMFFHDSIDTTIFNNVFDSNNVVITKWKSGNNRCLVPSHQFTYSTQFTSSGIFTISNQFIQTNQFSKSVDFILSNKFTSSNLFLNTAKFSNTDQFIGSNDFSQSKNFINSDQFSKSPKFFNTNEFSSTNIFINTGKFSQSGQFLRTKDFSNSNLFINSKAFSSSNIFLKTKYFTYSNPFIKTKDFSNSNKFAKSDEFTHSAQFLKTILFSRSALFFKSKQFSRSGQFISSKIFSNSKKFILTSQFSKSSEFIKSIQFSSTNDFLDSSHFTLSLNFAKSNLFTLTDQYSKSKIFIGSNKFTGSSLFTSSTHFLKTSKFIDTIYFSNSAKFYETKRYSESEKFITSNSFSLSPEFMKTSQFSFSRNFIVSNEFSKSQEFINSMIFSQSHSLSDEHAISIDQLTSQESNALRSNGIEKLSPSLVFSESKQFSKSLIFSHSSVFIYSENFSASKEFETSTKFSRSGNFIDSSKFRQSDVFSVSVHFSISGQFIDSMKFTQSDKLSISTQFLRSSNFIDSSKFSHSDHYSISSHYSQSGQFIETNKFSNSGEISSSYQFVSSSDYSLSNKFTISKFSHMQDIPDNSLSSLEKISSQGQDIYTVQSASEARATQSQKFSNSIKFILSSAFSEPNHHQDSLKFTKSNKFVESTHFSLSNKFIRSSIFSISDNFQDSIIFSKSKQLISSNMFSQSKDFNGSDNFNNTMKLSESEIFSRSSDLLRSNMFSFSSIFDISAKFSKSFKFIETKRFRYSTQFSESAQFFGSDWFSRSTNFVKSEEFSRSMTTSLKGHSSEFDNPTFSMILCNISKHDIEKTDASSKQDINFVEAASSNVIEEEKFIKSSENMKKEPSSESSSKDIEKTPAHKDISSLKEKTITKFVSVETSEQDSSKDVTDTKFVENKDVISTVINEASIVKSKGYIETTTKMTFESSEVIGIDVKNTEASQYIDIRQSEHHDRSIESFSPSYKKNEEEDFSSAELKVKISSQYTEESQQKESYSLFDNTRIEDSSHLKDGETETHLSLHITQNSHSFKFNKSIPYSTKVSVNLTKEESSNYFEEHTIRTKNNNSSTYSASKTLEQREEPSILRTYSHQSTTENIISHTNKNRENASSSLYSVEEKDFTLVNSKSAAIFGKSEKSNDIHRSPSEINYPTIIRTKEVLTPSVEKKSLTTVPIVDKKASITKTIKEEETKHITRRNSKEVMRTTTTKKEIQSTKTFDDVLNSSLLENETTKNYLHIIDENVDAISKSGENWGMVGGIIVAIIVIVAVIAVALFILFRRKNNMLGSTSLSFGDEVITEAYDEQMTQTMSAEIPASIMLMNNDENLDSQDFDYTYEYEEVKVVFPSFF